MYPALKTALFHTEHGIWLRVLPVRVILCAGHKPFLRVSPGGWGWGNDDDDNGGGGGLGGGDGESGGGSLWDLASGMFGGGND